ncbi:MAG TPA: hypothetical protein VFG86_27425, partial [Chloroflexota bacterium]|nr:hypothetical protein [Chloroflexota bacterium]
MRSPGWLRLLRLCLPVVALVALVLAGLPRHALAQATDPQLRLAVFPDDGLQPLLDIIDGADETLDVYAFQRDEEFVLQNGGGKWQRWELVLQDGGQHGQYRQFVLRFSLWSPYWRLSGRGSSRRRGDVSGWLRAGGGRR